MLSKIQALAFKIHLILSLSGILKITFVDKLFVNIYYIYKKFEAVPVSTLIPYIEPGSTVLDIGGGLGFYAKGFRNIVVNPGKVIIFEPNLKNFERILRIRDRGHVIAAYNVACSNRNGSVGFRVDEKNPANHQVDMNAGFSVPAIILDDWYDLDVPISLIKIDVQGHEVEVLEGLFRILKKHSPAILVEIDNRTSNSATEAILEILLKRQYRPLSLQNKTFSREMNREEILGRSGYFDLLFVH